MASEDQGPAAADLTSAREVVRSAVRWYVTGLGAVAAVLVAGSQLSSIGSLAVDSARFFAAIAGLIGGLAAILFAMSRVVGLLAGRLWSFEDLGVEWAATAEPPPGRWRALRRWWRRRRHPVGVWLREHPTSLGDFDSIPEIAETYANSAPGRQGLNELVVLMGELQDKAASVWLASSFNRLRRVIAVAVLVGSAGVALFAWAANPPKPENAPPALRHARLNGADLRGASLRGADLTGADLRGADLRGADLRDSTVDGVRWDGATCPDGTPANVAARPASEGAEAQPPTCRGHLAP